MAKQMFGRSWDELPGGATEPRASLIPSTEVSVQLFLVHREHSQGRPASRGTACPAPAEPPEFLGHQAARPILFQSSPAWGHPLPALPGVSSESPGQIGWWVTLFAPVAQPYPHLQVGSSGGPSWKDQFSAIPAPTRRVGVWVRVHDMSGSPSEKVSRGFQALQSLKAQDVLSPPHRSVEVPVQGDPPRPPHCTSAPSRGVGARTRDPKPCCLSSRSLPLDSCS